jgi:hypothetical protein
LQTPLASGRSASTGQQLPSRDGSAQETQGPSQATLQQTLSTQKPDRQPSLLVHLAPFKAFPQLPLPSQVCPSMHWVLAVHF